MNKTIRNGNIVTKTSTTNGVKELTTKTFKSGGTATSPKKDNKKALTKEPSVKVLSASNRINLSKMGTSKETAMSRRSRTSRRISLTVTSRRMSLSANTKKTTTSTNRKTIDPKSFNRKPIAASGETGQTGSSTILFAKPKKSTDKFRCKSCEMTFFYKTSLAAHEKNHVISNTCKYCNRKFSIAKALSKHLLENCSKISIAERKKLLEIDDKTTDLNRTVQKTPTRTPKLRRSTVELLDLVYKSCSPSDVDRLKAVQFKNVPSIKGIRCTPRKLIKCYKCGDKFKDPFSYATHAEHCVTTKADE